MHYGAHLSIKHGQSAIALPYLQRAMSLDPLSGEVSFYLAWAHLDLHDQQSAYEVVKRGLKYDPQDIDLRGMEYYLLFNRGESFKAFQRTLDLVVIDPSNIESLAGVVYPLVSLGEFDAAQRWTDRMAKEVPGHPAYFAAQLAVYATQGDSVGLEKLLGRWQTLNSLERIPHEEDEVKTAFGLECKLQLLSINANKSRAAGEHETARLLRQSAVELGRSLLTNDEGRLTINWMNQRTALLQTRNLHILGLDQEANEVARATLLAGDPEDRFEMTPLFAIRVLADDQKGALEAIASKVNHMIHRPLLESINHNESGLFSKLVEDPKYIAFYNAAMDSNEALRLRLRTELPDLLTASTGL